MTSPSSPVRPFEVTHRSVLAIAVPMTLGFVTTPLLGLTDTAVVGRSGSAEALAGLAIAAALFDISLGRFIAATFFGILPGTFAYAYLGQGVDSVLVAAQANGREAQISDLVTRDITLAFFALALVALIPTLVRQIRKRRSSP